MKQAEFLSKLITEHDRWQNELAKITPSRFEQAGKEGTWSVKEIIAHISWYEQEMVDLIRIKRLIGSTLWNLPIDQRNAAIQELNQNRPLQEILVEASQVYEQLVSAIRQLSDDDLDNPAHFKDMPLDWIPWQIIASNSYEHYSEHMPDLEQYI
jgi:hypothetical protein